MKIESYLIFEGRCDEAIEFYRQALGAEVEMLMRFKDNPEPPPPGTQPPGLEEKVMHASLKIGETRVMMADGYSSGKLSFEGIMLAISVASDDEAKQRFTALSEGGQVTVPLIKTFYSSSFGMLTDRFGVSWMVLVGKE